VAICWAITLLKGGAGKTTTSVFLSEAAASRGSSALLVDADPQATASAMAWSELAHEAGDPLRSTVVSLPTRDLRRRVATVSAGVDRVFIDTPPGHPEIVAAAIDAADLVVVPTLAAVMDIGRAHATVQAAHEAGKPAVVVLVRTRPVKAVEAAREALAEAGVPLAVTEIPQREVIAAAYGTRPKGAALRWYEELFGEIEKAMS